MMLGITRVGEVVDTRDPLAPNEEFTVEWALEPSDQSAAA
jgi:hypothetical protein